MSTSTILDTVLDVEWIQSKDQEITSHLAWHNYICEFESEKLLKGKAPFTYLLRRGEIDCLYHISFVKEDGHSIKHQFFVLERTGRGWLYRNGGGGAGSPHEIVSNDLNELILMMMHCELPSSANPLIHA